MKCFNLIRYDLKNGLFRNVLLLLTPICVAIVCNQCRLLLSLWEQSGNWAVYISYCFKGIRTCYHEILQIPIQWFLLLVLPLAITLNYPFRDMKNLGPQMLLRSESRTAWWLCKCGWNLCCSVAYFILLLATVTIFCVCAGVTLSLDTPISSMMPVFSGAEITTAVEEMTAGQTIFTLVVVPFLTIAASNMLELLLSILFRPVYSFLFSVALLAAGSYATSPLLFGNFANLSRCGTFIHDGLNWTAGFWICLGVIVFSIVVGAAAFHRQDILPDYKEL